MEFTPKFAQATLLKRYKRFLADIITVSGEEITIHCPNTGSMKNCMSPGASVWYSRSDNPKRKYPHTWEIATTPAGDLAGVNTGRANHLVREAIECGRIPSLCHPESIRAEVPYGQERSRIDFVVQVSGEEYYIEVKSVTLCEERGEGYFPDSVSERGAKHLRELTTLVKNGQNAILIYCVQHSGIKQVAPARHIDPVYSQAFDEAVAAGVKIIALGATLSDSEIVLDRELPVVT